jgi:hypothetical protein
MNQIEILEYNKLCAEFLGAKNIGKKGFSDDDYYQHDLFLRTEWSNKYQDNIEVDTLPLFSMKFHSDWNWIMEVKYRIVGSGYYWFQFPNIIQINENGTISSNKIVNLTFDKLNEKAAVVQAINQFLIWYSQNKTV